ncbi:MAG: DUF6893 family small protein [Blastocatellia bacterium]
MDLFHKKTSSNHLVWKIIGGTTLAALAYGLVTNFPDIKRLIKMHTM